MVYVFILLLVTIVLYAALACLEVFLEYRLELKKLDQKDGGDHDVEN